MFAKLFVDVVDFVAGQQTLAVDSHCLGKVPEDCFHLTNRSKSPQQMPVVFFRGKENEDPFSNIFGVY